MTLSSATSRKVAALSSAILLLSPAGVMAADGGDSTIPTTANTSSRDDRLVSFDGSRAVTGESRRPLIGAAFYLAVDRQDLADQYLLREDRKKEVATFGYVVLAAGLTWAAIDLFVTFAENTQCCDGPGPARIARVSPFPWMLAGAGLTTAVVAKSVSSDPVPLPQRVELARVHNARIGVLPQVRPDGVGLMMDGAF